MRHPFMQGGVVKGTIDYSWTNRAYKLFYTTQGYQEIFQFNPARGYDPITVTDRPFFNQWQYKSGRTCACETGPLSNAMPQMFVGVTGITSTYTATGSSVQIGTQTCQEYNRNAGTPGDVTKIFIANGQVCRAVYDDLREFTFSNVQATAQAASTFTPPSGCKCGQPVDIAIVLDRSGSISQDEFKSQKAFVVGFTGAFSYGPLGANLAIVHFNTPAWTTLTMPEGVSDANVLNAVNDLKCCTSSRNMADSCCCCGTSISSGMRLGADQLKLGRARVEKVLIVVTDGYHNHDINGRSCPESSATCRADLQAATNYVKATVPGVKIYAVGVGADRDVSMDELLIVADQKPERVIRYTDFTNLAQNSLDLVARACQENLNPCGGCCGFCVCGQCTAPDQCDSTDFCNPNALSGVCCKKAPKDCVDPNNKCATYACDAARGECVATPTSCKANSTCFQYACAPATGVCNTITNPSCSGQPECINNGQCDDGNLCTNDICDTATGTCRWENTAAACNDNNLCTVDTCDPRSGCSYTPVPADYCNDTNVCTNDRCDPQLGCVNEQISCADDNACTDDTCDPFKGCLNTPKVCPNDGKDKCKLLFCLNGTCTERKQQGGCAVPVVVAAAALSTAAIIGIIIGVVLCVAGVGAGGAYAYSQAAGSGSVAPVANNPIYVGSGAQGTNPLYKS